MMALGKRQTLDLLSSISLVAVLALSGCGEGSRTTPTPVEEATATPSRTIPPMVTADTTGTSIVWSADHETGDLSQWTTGQANEAVFNSGTGQTTVTRSIRRSGQYAIQMTIIGADASTEASRIFRWRENLPEAYYSVWMYFPQRYRPTAWWNVFQFKSPDADEESLPTWSVNVGTRSTGEMYFYLWDSLNRRAYHDARAVRTIPVGEWIQITVFCRRATDKSGRIAMWQGDTLLYDIAGVQTSVTDTIIWGLANYTDDITPSDATIYFDDAIISMRRT